MYRHVLLRQRPHDCRLDPARLRGGDRPGRGPAPRLHAVLFRLLSARNRAGAGARRDHDCPCHGVGARHCSAACRDAQEGTTLTPIFEAFANLPGLATCHYTCPRRMIGVMGGELLMACVTTDGASMPQARGGWLRRYEDKGVGTATSRGHDCSPVATA